MDTNYFDILFKMDDMQLIISETINKINLLNNDLSIYKDKLTYLLEEKNKIIQLKLEEEERQKIIYNNMITNQALMLANEHELIQFYKDEKYVNCIKSMWEDEYIIFYKIVEYECNAFSIINDSGYATKKKSSYNGKIKYMFINIFGETEYLDNRITNTRWENISLEYLINELTLKDILKILSFNFKSFKTATGEYKKLIDKTKWLYFKENYLPKIEFLVTGQVLNQNKLKNNEGCSWPGGSCEINYNLDNNNLEPIIESIYYIDVLSKKDQYYNIDLIYDGLLCKLELNIPFVYINIIDLFKTYKICNIKQTIEKYDLSYSGSFQFDTTRINWEKQQPCGIYYNIYLYDIYGNIYKYENIIGKFSSTNCGSWPNYYPDVEDTNLLNTYKIENFTKLDTNTKILKIKHLNLIYKNQIKDYKTYQMQIINKWKILIEQILNIHELTLGDQVELLNIDPYEKYRKEFLQIKINYDKAFIRCTIFIKKYYLDEYFFSPFCNTYINLLWSKLICSDFFKKINPMLFKIIWKNRMGYFIKDYIKETIDMFTELKLIEPLKINFKDFFIYKDEKIYGFKSSTDFILIYHKVYNIFYDILKKFDILNDFIFRSEKDFNDIKYFALLTESNLYKLVDEIEKTFGYCKEDIIKIKTNFIEQNISYLTQNIEKTKYEKRETKYILKIRNLEIAKMKQEYIELRPKLELHIFNWIIFKYENNDMFNKFYHYIADKYIALFEDELEYFYKLNLKYFEINITKLKFNKFTIKTIKHLKKHYELLLEEIMFMIDTDDLIIKSSLIKYADYLSKGITDPKYLEIN